MKNPMKEKNVGLPGSCIVVDILSCGSREKNVTFRVSSKREDVCFGGVWGGFCIVGKGVCLYYYGARYYDSRTSVWLGVDPLAEKYPGWSPYNYTFNNPINYFDPNGKEGEPAAYYMNRQGFWIENDAGFGEYIGNVAPNTSSYQELIKVKGAYYHKNTTNVPAIIGNMLGGDFVEHKPYSPTDEDFFQEMMATALGFGVLKAGGLAFQILKKAGGSLWKIPAINGMGSRGFVYERMLGLKGLMKAHNFPVIDAFYNGVATSVKTLDIFAKSYAKPGAITKQLTKYIDDLANFNGRTWGDDIVNGSDITSRVLEVGIRRGASKAQVQEINKAISHGAKNGVKVNVRVVD